MNLEILYQDEDIIVVNKPAGTTVIPERFNTEAVSVIKHWKKSWVRKYG